MSYIIQLDEPLANKIAAGEVVERPASIVKELVENAIDAHSTKILIDVEEGGLSKIRIVDNGDGIVKEDIERAFLRHATSKIKTDQDLFRIRTLGFRGEALPSISSVSFLELNSSTGEEAGTKIQLEGGKIIAKSPAKSRKGTEVIVTNLFYNTPARLKYLKTIHTELGNISDVVNRLALAHPNISFQLVHNGKKLLQTNGSGDQLQVIHAIYGLSVAKHMHPFEQSSIDFHITGYVASPEVTRASRQYMSIFINGRYIKNFTLFRAIQDGYHTLLPIGRYPLAVLNIELDPTLVDVNVHPAKMEVRLSKEDDLATLVKEGIQSVFKKIQLIPEISHSKQDKPISVQMPLPWSDSIESDIQERTIKSDRQERAIKSFTEMVRESPAQPSAEANHQEVPDFQEEVSDGTIESETISSHSEDIEKGAEKEIEPIEHSSEWKEEHFSRVPIFYPIGQMHGTYILAQNEHGLYLIDQHAAQERINYEYYREKVGEVSNDLQQLLMPITVECTAGEYTLLEEKADLLQEVGLFLEPFGFQTFIIRSHPTWFPKGAEEETIREIIDEVLENKQINIKKFREKAAILMSCKAAIKANRHLRNDEIFALLERLRKCSDPFTCPHGRPVIIQFSTYEIEKMFKRVQ